MTPPQAPPAHTQTIYQEASDAFDRMVGFQAWLATEHAAIPALPDAIDPGALAPYLSALDAHWTAAPADVTQGASRRTAVSSRIAAAARDLAVLGHHDGHLDEASLALVRSVTSGAPAPAGVTVREVLFGTVTYAGILLVEDERASGRVLAFSQDRGWESFPRRLDAHAEIERRARVALVRVPDLRGIARQDLESIGPGPFVDSREIAGNPFDAFVARLIDVQADKLRQAWFEYSLADGGEARERTFADAAHDALRPDHVFNVEAVLAVRHATLLQVFNEQRLRRVPEAVAAGWRAAEDEYASVIGSLGTRESAANLPVVMDLATYASDAIGERLRAMGITHAPADIMVQVDRSSDVTARLESLQALFEGPAPESIRLLDLAYQNIAAFDPVRLSASAGDGTPIARLGDTEIRSLVRGLDLSSRYRAYVDATFRSGSDAPMRRAHAASFQLAHMRLLAAEARLSYYLDDAPRSFLTDRAERGFRWVQAALDAPAAAGRARVEGHDVVVWQPTYLGTPLREILTFGVRHPGSVASVVLYTPGAPDGITFREFADRAEAGRKFFYQPMFREYLLDRLPAEYARMLPNGSSREFAGDNLANWVLGAPSATAYTRTQAPFEEREVSGDFLSAAYDVDVQSGLRNLQTFTRSAEQAQWTWLVGRLGTTVTDKLVEDAIKGVVTAPARAAQAAWRLYDNVKAGDHAQAAVDFAEFYNASIVAALPVHAMGSSAVAHGIARARFRVAGRLVDTRSAARSTVVFEPRFIARNVRKTGAADREGIFTIEGKSYIEHDGTLYRVAHDADYATWRLSRPEAGNAFRGPAIQRTPEGHWTYRQVGLRGGSGRGAAGSSERLPDLYDELQAEIDAAFPDPGERELVSTRMRFERAPWNGAAMPPPPLVSPGQRVRWADALNRARVRQVARVARPGPSAPAVAVDLRAPYREIAQAQAPADLWYYDNRPFQTSGLERHRGVYGDMYATTTRGYSNDVANISAGLIERDMYGIRLTTVPPTASIQRINEAMGVNHITRYQAFAVRVDPRSLYEPLAEIVQRRWHGGWQGRNAALLTPTSGPANVFIARPMGGGPLRLGRGQFEVHNSLPPEASP